MAINTTASKNPLCSHLEAFDQINFPYTKELTTVLQIPSLVELVNQYANSIIQNRTKWQEALDKIKRLPDRIPPPPLNIHAILHQDCSISCGKIIDETHSLFLVPSGPIEKLAQQYSELEHTPPLSHPVYSMLIRKSFESTIFEKFTWILITNDLLPESQCQTYERQVQMINTLSRKASFTYELPTLKHAIAAYLLDKSSGGAGLWATESSYRSNYTRVQETFVIDRCGKVPNIKRIYPEARNLIVGGMTILGPIIKDFLMDEGDSNLGAAAVCTFMPSENETSYTTSFSCILN